MNDKIRNLKLDKSVMLIVAGGKVFQSRLSGRSDLTMHGANDAFAPEPSTLSKISNSSRKMFF